MTRTRADALALVNWKGIFYERYLLDRHVTALEGANGAGKTTVMIAAYVVLLPDMSRLRFTNLGETGAQHRADGGKGGAAHRLAFQRARIDRWLEAQPSQAAHEMAFHGHIAFWRQVSHERIFFPQACEQGGGAPVHETGRQRKV